MSTLVTFLLDRSGSMQSCKSATIEAFNAYLGSLKEETAAELNFTFLQFDSEGFDKVCVATPVAGVPLLTEATYQPRGGTPLIDAVFKTIKAVEEAVTRDPTTKVVICVQTDGEENQSTQHTWEELKALIERRTAEGWQFNFMGAGIDAYAQGAKMGIAAGSTMSYDHTDKVMTQNAFTASAANTRLYAAGARSDTSYTRAQRHSSGDRFAPPNLGGLAMKTGDKLDLTTPTPTSVVVRRQALPDVEL